MSSCSRAPLAHLSEPWKESPQECSKSTTFSLPEADHGELPLVFHFDYEEGFQQVKPQESVHLIPVSSLVLISALSSLLNSTYDDSTLRTHLLLVHSSSLLVSYSSSSLSDYSFSNVSFHHDEVFCPNTSMRLEESHRNQFHSQKN